MKAPNNNFIVDFDSPFDDEIKTKSGVKLFRDTSFNPENFAQTNGTVTSVPRFNCLDMDVVPGDQVYFSYKVVMDWEQRDSDTPHHRNMIWWKSEKHWKVFNEHIFFRTRGDEIKMLNDFMLLDIIETEVESTLIIPEYLKKQKLIGSAIIVKSGDDSVAEFADIVFFDKRFVETYEYWGNFYYLLKKERILGKL